MLTRLKVNGFKNLVDIDVRFGPFTCIAGANGVGKSNLFDAIQLLSALASKSLIEAALSIRDEGGRTADIRSLFHRVGDDNDSEMSFEAEMIVPREGVDDLGQKATASITFLRYALTLAYRSDESSRSLGSLEIVKEELVHIKKGDASRYLLFPHKADAWRDSVVQGGRWAPYFISTEGTGPGRIIKRHQDGGSSGRPLSLSASNLPRTVLSVANAAESPTALLARREMQSWRLLQLEPSALRKPDEFTGPTQLGVDGSHLPATLYYLARLQSDSDASEKDSIVYGQVANRLADLIDDVYRVNIDRDERRELLTLLVTDKRGTSHPARALSDGTLRFLALAVLELEPQSHGLLCLEEPENGIHPERIPAMLRLLQDIATDVTQRIGDENPLRQVIINTHSPSVVSQVPEDSLLWTELKETVRNGHRFRSVSFNGLPDTWRVTKAGERPVAIGKLGSYLNPVSRSRLEFGLHSIGNGNSERLATKIRVVDREDLQLLLPGMGTLRD